MRKRTGLTRRTVLKHCAKGAAAAIAVPYLLPACSSPANDKIQLGFIGLGWRFNLIMNYMPKNGFAVVAFCDVYDAKMEYAKAIFNKDAATYKNYRDLLASDKVDAVVIATPDHWHALQCIEACRAGKDVYVEKPLALTIAEGSAMVRAARENKRIVQVGTQQRSKGVCMQGCQAVLDGTIGKVKEVHGANYPSSWDCDVTEEQAVPDGLDWDTWLGQTPPHVYNDDIYKNSYETSSRYPDGRPKGWHFFTPWSGGGMTAMGAHGLDVIQWALGKDRSGPVEAWPEHEDESAPIKFGPFPLKDNSWKEGHALTCPVHFKYADGTMVHLDEKGPALGGLFVGERGTIMVDRDIFQMKMSGEEMKTVREPESDNDGTGAHMNHWIECIQSRKLSRSDVEIAHRSTTMCHLGNIARRLGRKIVWDPETETFGDDTEANKYIRREARRPWVVT